MLERARAAGIGRMLCPATDRQSSEACVELARHYDGIYAAVGIHPQEAGRVQPGDIEAIRRMAEQNRLSWPSAKWVSIIITTRRHGTRKKKSSLR